MAGTLADGGVGKKSLGLDSPQRFRIGHVYPAAFDPFRVFVRVAGKPADDRVGNLSR